MFMSKFFPIFFFLLLIFLLLIRRIGKKEKSYNISTSAEGKKNTQKSESISNALFVRFLEWVQLLINTNR